MDYFLILFGKLASFTSKNFHLGHGGTWPGHIALKVNPKFVSQVIQRSNMKVILIAGTNGKTTTSKMISAILIKNGKKVLHNDSGANLLNGIASSLILHSSILSTLKYDYAIFEVDENTLPHVLKEITPDYVLLLNLFRDQLDRYGEVRTIASKWKKALESLPESTTLVLNADDPEIAYLGETVSSSSDRRESRSNNETIKQLSNDSSQQPRIIKYFGLENKDSSKKQMEHAADSMYCPKCGTKLSYASISFSHLGDWKCNECKLKRPQLDSSSAPNYPLTGLYNKYNTIAATLLSSLLGISEENIKGALQNFSPAFGRQEKIQIGDKLTQIFLSKNPASFNQSLQTIMEQKPKAILFVLNDRIPDGHDVSWIWDTDIEEYDFKKARIFVSGDRVYDMTLRLKYALQTQNSNLKTQSDDAKFKSFEKLPEAISEGFHSLNPNETLYILPTYSAMLEVRQILKGRKIL